MYRHAVEYELMPRVRGEACASAAVEDSQYKRTRDPSKIVNGFLYEKAKVLALDSTQNADGLIEIRSTFEYRSDGNECVIVTGRPYHITAMRAVPGPERPTDPIAHKPETPLGEVIEPTFQGQ